MNARRIVGLLAAAGLVLGLTAVVANPAGAASSPDESAVAQVASGPFAVQFQAHRAAGVPADAATGIFTAHASIGSIGLFTLHGPVTCLDVRGDRMGLFYPITSSDPAVFAKLGSGVFIYLQVSPAGKPQLLSFVPSLSAHTSSCAPSLTLFPITSGTASLTS